MSRNRSWNVAFAFFVALVFALVSHAQAPTSRVIHYDNVQTDVLSTPGQPFRLQLFDIPTGGTPRYCEDQPLDTDAAGLISFDFGAGTPSAPPCPSSPPGLNPNDFTSGESRYLDVVDPSTGTSHLTARVPVKAVGFAVNPGPQGPQGIQGPPGQQGPPGVVQTVTAGDVSVSVAGTAANPTVAVAANGINNAHVANGALSPAKIAGTAATLGPNIFAGDQNVLGNLIVSNPGGAAVESRGLFAVRGNAVAGGFAIVGNAPTNGIAGQFNGSVNVTGPLSAGANLTTASDIFVGNVPNPAFPGSNSVYIENSGGDPKNSLRLDGYFDHLVIAADSAPGALGGAAIQFRTALAGGGEIERMEITPNGNVGIGTNVPTAKLDVAGDVSVRGLLQFGAHYIEGMGLVIQPGGTGGAEIVCPLGEKVLSGGFDIAGEPRNARLLTATWTTPAKDRWQVRAANVGLPGSGDISVVATTVCARISLP